MTMATVIAPFAPPPAAVVRFLSRFNRTQLEGFVAVAIDLMDLADGDPDREETDLEDSFAFSGPASLHLSQGPGCPISDPGASQANEDEPNGAGSEYADRGPGCPVADPPGGVSYAIDQTDVPAYWAN